MSSIVLLAILERLHFSTVADAFGGILPLTLRGNSLADSRYFARLSAGCERRREVAEEAKYDVLDGCLINLTKREIEVLSLVLEGKSSREVAASLFCSKRTIDFHLARIYEKLRVTNRVQAMRRATLLGLVNLEACALPK